MRITIPVTDLRIGDEVVKIHEFGPEGSGARVTHVERWHSSVLYHVEWWEGSQRRAQVFSLHREREIVVNRPEWAPEDGYWWVEDMDGYAPSIEETEDGWMALVTWSVGGGYHHPPDPQEVEVGLFPTREEAELAALRWVDQVVAEEVEADRAIQEVLKEEHR